MEPLQRNKGLNYNTPTSQRRTFSKSYQLTMLMANSISLVWCVTYLSTDMSPQSGNLLGILLILTLVGNHTLTLMTGNSHFLDYAYLVLSMLTMIIVPILNTYASLDVNNLTSQSIVSISLIPLLLFLGMIISLTKINYQRRHSDHMVTLFNTKQPNHIKYILKRSLLFLLGLNLVIGVYLSYSLLDKNVSAGIFSIFIPQYSFFIGMYFLGLVVLILNLRNQKPLSNFFIGFVGFSVFLIFNLPMLIVPFHLQNAEEDYTAVFGPTNDSIPNQFMDVPFSIPEYIFGTPSDNFILNENITFYRGTEGVDLGLQLAFDAYLPPTNQQNLPGNNSVLIRIHGGGWTVGDKGAANFSQVNKYFASQGYVVFDVQYGLANKEKFIESAPVPASRIGEFSIDDMVRHIGIFTNYLVENNDEYNANLDSVFISGGSAGGQLANSVGLAIASERYTELFHSALTVRGLIPLYPANGLATNIGINGSKELVNPILLVNENSPPALVYQGTHDKIVDPIVASTFKTTYRKESNNQAALIMMPFGTHASDIYFPSYYNRVFIYYMERFMYQFK
ncbi:alpha/beta hydrolase fold domain-containing protein [Aquibacillus halophilus]|uniref:Alpha/beta hydrolase fold domain-containing protein n=1 Tax=Aquibacillus halophilus TaxID=930132 RepID=A0A6A8DIS2_9BACI|nr:alpha/beta hydrolase [Aquibacillus halophilus]MRH44356.1 alpha/beta hydrolase fold domain-containing protein [Aquibacillus halophilus]